MLPVTIFRAAGYDGMASRRTQWQVRTFFPGMGSVLIGLKGHHLSARGAIPLDSGHGFLVFLLLYHQQQLLSPLHPPMGGLGCLTFLTPPHPKCSTEPVFSPSPQVMLSLCGPTRTVHLNPLPLPFTRVWTCQVSVFKSPCSTDRTFIMELLPEL